MPAPETAAQAAKRGIAYDHVLSQAQSGDRDSLITLLRLSRDLSSHAVVNHGAILLALLRRLGDQAFAASLLATNAAVRDAVGIALARAILPENKFALLPEIKQPLIGEAGFAQKFPLTYAALFPVSERVRYFMTLVRHENEERSGIAHPLHEEIVALGDAAAPALIEMLADNRPVRVRLEPPRGNGNNFYAVIYLTADDKGKANTVADFAYFCLCRLREPVEGTYEQYEEYWRAALSEIIDGDGEISATAINACKAWWQKRAAAEFSH